MSQLYPTVHARDLTLSTAQIKELVDDEQGFLADVHATVSYSLFERARRQELCKTIISKLDKKLPIEDLTSREASFIADLARESA